MAYPNYVPMLVPVLPKGRAMQTFVPYADIRESAKVLDRQRLGKQRVEVLQIAKALSGQTQGWRNHPATKMWENNLAGLIAYGVAVCDEWTSRGYKDTCREKMTAICLPDANDMPLWWGDEAVHASHRSNLLRKSEEYYRQFGWEEEIDMPYVWPSEMVIG